MKLLIVALLLIGFLGVRYYLVSSYRVSTLSMEDALHKGDHILVNKWKKQPERKDVVLFSASLYEDNKQVRSLLLSRCLGMPGDTIQINENGYFINGKPYPFSPRTLSVYYMKNHIAQEIFDILKRLNIPLRSLKNNEENTSSFGLTSSEESMVREKLPNGAVHLLTKQPTGKYSLIIPQKNRHYRLDEKNIMAYRDAILSEAGDRAVFRDGKLYLDGKEATFFFFTKDYYWLLSDNTEEAIDSRYLGIIPSENILGTAWFCWMSQTKEQIFRWVE